VRRKPAVSHWQTALNACVSTFLIEYDNTQNNANHIHCVWRDFNGDWGEDLLAEHYRNSPHHR
jgi:hypothetical protein